MQKYDKRIPVSTFEKYLSSIVSILFEYDIRALTPTYMTIEIPER